MLPTAGDYAALRKAIDRITEKQATILEEVEAELGSLPGIDKHKRTLVVASAMWLTTINAFAIAHRDEEAFLEFMQGLLHDSDQLLGHYRKAQARRAELHQVDERFRNGRCANCPD
jgi:hypothetical protein